MNALRFHVGDVVFDPAGNVSLIEEGDGAVGTTIAGSALRLAYRARPRASNAFECADFDHEPGAVIYYSDGCVVFDKGDLTSLGIAELFFRRALHPKSAFEWLEKCVKATAELLALGRSERGGGS